jgi:hypothetical protein
MHIAHELISWQRCLFTQNLICLWSVSDRPLLQLFRRDSVILKATIGGTSYSCIYDGNHRLWHIRYRGIEHIEARTYDIDIMLKGVGATIDDVPLSYSPVYYWMIKQGNMLVC